MIRDQKKILFVFVLSLSKFSQLVRGEKSDID